MRTVGLKLLKNKLSEYIRAAAAGETIQVTDRNKIVAELRPVNSERARSYEQFRAEAIREGRLRPATRRGAAALPPRRPLASFDDIMKELDQDREDR